MRQVLPSNSLHTVFWREGAGIRGWVWTCVLKCIGWAVSVDLLMCAQLLPGPWGFSGTAETAVRGWPGGLAPVALLVSSGWLAL